MGLLKRTGSNVGWVALSDLLVKSAVVFATIYLARVLGVANFGMFSLGVAIASTVWPLVDLGVNGYGTREVARRRELAQGLLSSLNSLRLAAAILAMLVAALILGISGMPDTKKWIILAALLYLPSFALSPDWVIRGIEKMRWLLVMNLLTAGLYVVFILWLVHDPQDVVAASLIRALSFAAGSIAGLVLLTTQNKIKFEPKVDFAEGWHLIRQASHFLFNRVAANIGQFLPLFLVTILMTDADVGLFAAPHRLYIIALAGLMAITAAVYPIMSNLFHEKPDAFVRYQRQLVQALTMAFIPVAGVGIVGSAELITTIFGNDYAKASTALLIMLITLPVIAIRSIFMLTLLCGGLERKTFPIMIGSVVVQAMVALIAIPYYGIAAAAAAMLLSELVASSVLVYVAVKSMQVQWPVDRNFMLVVAFIAALSLLAWRLDWSLAYIFLVGIPLYAMALLLSGQIPVQKIRSLFSR